MGKIDELREKYPKITKVSFDKLTEGDKTPTKKYVEYMLKMWQRKIHQDIYIPSTVALLKRVVEFDSLLPYIENKDIYHSIYNSFDYLEKTINDAQRDKEQKTFNRSEHITVLDETDTYLLLQPKTHTGSLKYGASTRWCTASRGNAGTFTTYKNDGCLAYLIDKTGKKSGGNYSKVALYMPGHANTISNGIQLFNTQDNNVGSDVLLRNGWTKEEMLRINFIFRAYALEWGNIKKSVVEIDKVIATIRMINLDSFKKHLQIVESYQDYSYINTAKEALIGLVQNIKKYENGVTTT
jgi:hypothetical protein